MRKKLAVLAGVCVLGLCVGCGQQADGAAQGHEISEADVSETENDGAEADGEGGLSGGDALPDEAGGLADEAGAAETEADSADVQPAADDWNRAGLESGEPSPSAKEEKGLEIPENGRRLTEEELAEYTEWIQDFSNYGFLLSDWENPAEIDLYQVFYSSAGVGRPGTDEEKQAHLARWNYAEIETDFGAIDKVAVDALLLEKVGFTYDGLVAKGSRGMKDWYYAETDSFCSESGDTNYCRFVCVDGVLNEDGTVVTLQFDGDDWVRTCEVKVSVESGHRRFLSNHIAEGWIRDTETFSETHTEERGDCLIEASVFENLNMDADASAVENTYVLGDWGKITKEALQGIWYYHPKDVGDSEEYDVVLQFDGDKAVVYYPAVEFYGDTYYEWDVVDRSSRGLCPELAIYWRGTKEGELAWYILGISEERDYFWCNGEVFYKQ
ncbi:MAG: hypothetical protein HFI54_06370 [Lachnospiraceae bacterium]|nr:hypothetical protein [Lachnospiraceae bacterium]